MLGFGKKQPEDGPIPGQLREVTDETELFATLEVGPAVIYKHSDRCGLCRRSLRELEKFAAGSPAVPVLKVDVVGSRALSDEIADRLEVHHESPQAIVVNDGDVVWSGSHRAVTASRIAEALAEPG